MRQSFIMILRFTNFGNGLLFMVIFLNFHRIDLYRHLNNQENFQRDIFALLVHQYLNYLLIHSSNFSKSSIIIIITQESVMIS